MLCIGRLFCKLMAQRETAATFVNITVVNHFTCQCIDTVLMTQWHHVLRVHIDFCMTHQLVSQLINLKNDCWCCMPASQYSFYLILHIAHTTQSLQHDESVLKTGKKLCTELCRILCVKFKKWAHSKLITGIPYVNAEYPELCKYKDGNRKDMRYDGL
jgi:hypothetical protein